MPVKFPVGMGVHRKAEGNYTPKHMANGFQSLTGDGLSHEMRSGCAPHALWLLSY